MAWYWWIAIVAALAAIGLAKFYIMKKYNEKNRRKSDDEEDSR